MLDLSTTASPQVRKTLKRSASTASLPTPPRTSRKNVAGVHKKRRVDNGEDEDLWLGGRSEATGSNSKTSGAIATSKMESAPSLYRVDNGDHGEEKEDLFWLGGRSETIGSNAKTSGVTATKLESAPWLYRKSNVQSSLVGSAPVSPPPSHRKPKTRPVTPKKPSSPGENGVLVDTPPSTPRRYMTRSARRDSPDNPFLSTPIKDGDRASPSADSASPSPSTPNYDKPYVTYVFRGRRRTYQNPHYDHAKGRPVSPSPGSQLPFEHPDYSPSLICPPKRLFTRASRQDKKTHNAQPLLNSPTGNEDDDEVLDIRPKKLNFATAKRAMITRAKSSTNKRSS